MTLLSSTLLAAGLMAGALTLSPLAATQAATHKVVPGARAPHSQVPFPVPASGMDITQAECDSMSALLDKFSKVTGEGLIYDSDTDSLLRNKGTGLRQELWVEAEDVYSVLQDILIANRLVLIDVRRAAPRLLMVQSLDSASRSRMKSHAHYVPEKDLSSYSQYSAMLVTTTIFLPNLDVRTMGNSLRQLVVDPNTMQLIPLPESHQVILTGFGNSVAMLAALLKDMDVASGKVQDAAAKTAAEEPCACKTAAPAPQAEGAK